MYSRSFDTFKFGMFFEGFEFGGCEMVIDGQGGSVVSFDGDLSDFVEGDFIAEDVWDHSIDTSHDIFYEIGGSHAESTDFDCAEWIEMYQTGPLPIMKQVENERSLRYSSQDPNFSLRFSGTSSQSIGNGNLDLKDVYFFFSQNSFPNGCLRRLYIFQSQKKRSLAASSLSLSVLDLKCFFVFSQPMTSEIKGMFRS